jgi:hypothetical protein
LPTDEQKERLAEALKEGKALRLQMGLSMLQPKWHLTFDGHLLDQFTKYGGLADKSDESIEKGHQTLKALRNRFRGIPTYKQHETCIRRNNVRHAFEGSSAAADHQKYNSISIILKQ